MSDAKKLITCLSLFSLSDLLFSLYEFREGLAVEANPVLAFYYENSEFAFIMIKAGLTLAACFLLWYVSGKRDINKIIYFLCFSYLLLIIYHSYGILFLT